MPKRIDEIRARLECSKSEPLYSIVEPWAEDIAYLLDLLAELKPHLDVAIEALDSEEATNRQHAIHHDGYASEEYGELAALQNDARTALEAIKEKLG